MDNPANPYPLDRIVRRVEAADTDGEPVTLLLIADGRVEWDRTPPAAQLAIGRP